MPIGSVSLAGSTQPWMSLTTAQETLQMLMLQWWRKMVHLIMNHTTTTVQPVTGAAGGVETITVEQAEPTIQRFEPDSPVANEEGFVEAPNVDVARELVTQSIARYTAEANLTALEVQNETRESLLDILT